MKVVFCAYDGKDVINGINAWLIRLLPRLAKKNVEVSVIFISSAPEKDCTTIPILRAEGIECSIIPTAHYTERFIKWILNYLTRENADVFVPGNMIPALHACRWIKEAGIATVGILHNDDLEYRAIIDEFIADSSKDYLSVVIAVSQALTDLIKLHNFGGKVYCIPYGAPVSKYRTKLTPNQVFKVIYIGRIVKEQKRIDEVAKAFCISAKKLSNTEFYIYGSGPDINIVTEILKEYSNPRNVFFKGSILPTQVPDVLINSQVVVLMSEYEGIPVALMEAMGCGVVPICKLINSGIPELVMDNVTGFLIDNYEELVAKIDYLQNNSDKWNEMSVNSKALITKSFSSERNAESWMGMLISVTKKEKRKIKIPFRIKLAKVNTQFGNADRREPNVAIKAFRKIKRMLNN